MVDASAFAIGRLLPGGPWIGLRRTDAGYDLVFGRADGSLLSAPASAADLLAVAIGYFEESVDDAPPELEATHHDLALLLRSLHDAESQPARARLLLEAIEGIDDGLAGDVMVSRLSAAYETCRTANEQADPIDLLADRYRALSS
ncbi:MAG TPA: hypothetical protein VFX74_08165 [Candidatus Limnocylindria bacterium]|nr:hypothetical protein [Candidatus Limnocylindria bacterium]